LNVKKNEAYPVFSNASCNQKIPWPDDLASKTAGQINAFFRWKNISDTQGDLQMSLCLVSPTELKTTFEIPGEASADVSLRRIQNMHVKPNQQFHWIFGTAKGDNTADANGLMTIPALKITSQPTTLRVGVRK